MEKIQMGKNKMKNILVFNVGSSSLKYSLFDNLKKINSENFERLKNKRDFEKTVSIIIEKLKDQKIDAIAHRVVHGGELNKPSKINKKIKDKIKDFSEFAPLHNPNQLRVIEICEEKFKQPQYAVFDTMFFAELPEVAKTYPIPKEITEKYKLRRYGFHGLSHKFISQGLKRKTITCHLGSGSSIAAIYNGKPLDTSMGLTPLEGLTMGTRSGTIDPGLILFLEKKGYDVNKILTEKSGLKGLCGHNDFRDILSSMKNCKDCKLAYSIFIYKIIRIIGAYTAVLNGLDNLVFTAGIGEQVPKLRKDICKNLKFLKLKLNDKKNKKGINLISSRTSKVKVYVRKTDEEKQIVKEILRLK
jgi:acetate kinase